MREAKGRSEGFEGCRGMRQKRKKGVPQCVHRVGTESWNTAEGKRRKNEGNADAERKRTQEGINTKGYKRV